MKKTFLIASASFMVGFFGSHLYCLFSDGGMAFDRALWVAASKRNYEMCTDRWGMVGYIQRNIVIPGMPMDVISVLGEPDYVVENTYRYNLGVCSGIGADYDHLIVKVNTGKIERVFVYQL